jgi:FtsP/CotA-like multicopper oxidase with cupredoxin domain
MAAGAPDAGDYTDDVPLQPTIIRDTVTVNAGSYLVLRVIAENPGVWIMHCQ